MTNSAGLDRKHCDKRVICMITPAKVLICEVNGLEQDLKHTIIQIPEHSRAARRYIALSGGGVSVAPVQLSVGPVFRSRRG